MTQEQRETLAEVSSRLYSYRYLMELSEKEQDFLDVTIQLLDGVLDFDGVNEHKIEVDDAVKVVHCKDCKHLQESGHCDKTCLWIGNEEDGGCDDFFCGFGERKTE